MKPFRRRTPDREPAGPSDEAIAARERAEAALDRARSRKPIVKALGESLREVQKENHLAEALEHALLKGHPR